MKFLNNQSAPYELTYSDVFMMPSKSSAGSCMGVDLSTNDGTGTTIPIAVPNMAAISGCRMTETTTHRGGIAILLQDAPADIAAEIIHKVKSAGLVFDTPIVVKPHHTAGYACHLLPKCAHGAAVVVEDNKPVGLITGRNLAGADNFAQVGTLMSTSLFTLPADTEPRDTFDQLTASGHKLAPVVNADGALVGILTHKGALHATLYKLAVDAEGKLRVGAAFGIDGDVEGRAKTLPDVGADVLVVDTAHGHQESMLRALQRVRAFNPPAPIATGNVVTVNGVRDLVEAGADIIKIGVGPGAMCTTRMQTGVGRPQFSAVLECAATACEYGMHVWADGGVKDSRDVALTLAAGASNVMISSWFAGTFESPGDVQKDVDRRMFKKSFGMVSHRAVENRNAQVEAFEKVRHEMFGEGISTTKIYLEPGRGGVEDQIDRIISGVRSSFTYAGSATIEQFAERAVVGIQSAAGFAEGMPRATW